MHSSTDGRKNTTSMNLYRQIVLSSTKVEQMSNTKKERLFVHLTYCHHMQNFPLRFHALWKQYFSESSINEVQPILETRNAGT
jgi:hypothetical protein